ncbi:MAG: protein kinase, partial [Planctomycetota bacterium]
MMPPDERPPVDGPNAAEPNTACQPGTGDDRGRAARLFGAKSTPGRRKVVGRMGPWQLVRLLGEGAMTRVYLSRPVARPDAAPSYAVKVLRKEWWRDTAAIEMIRREAMVGRRLNYPGLPAVLSAHVDGPPFYTVMARLHGETAATLLATNRRPPLARVLWIGRQVVEALAALAAETGMTHGDVKPENILVSPDGHTTLLDLGLCRTADESQNWADRPVAGTLRYLAPELVTSVTAGG